MDQDQFIYLAIQNLMFAERIILDMERQLARDLGTRTADLHESVLLMECSSHSIFWVCGLYELTRSLREAKSPQFSELAALHRKLSVVRMPLAKHEVMSAPGFRDKFHYPTSIWSPNTGRVGWYVFSPDSEQNESYFRTELADEFLAVTATEANQ